MSEFTDDIQDEFFSRKAGNGGQELEKQVTAMGLITEPIPNHLLK
jgi:hypothetical protein